mmetsp:Transcript_12610/g.11155  ORF Transcript_12610/g.11155 Transcript_12610/m.11155 type:complete len:205 (-) Transcript_12610:125-739(-)
MRFVYSFVLISVLLLTFKVSCNPQPPHWPYQWKANFTENFNVPYLFNVTTKGTYYFDWANGLFRLNRMNSSANKFCRINGLHTLSDQECDMYINHQGRYIYYPDSNDCCYCCGPENGCGMLSPTWASSADYIGEETFDGHKAFRWNMKGLENNFLVETTESNPTERTLLLIDQNPQDYTHFHHESFSKDLTESDIGKHYHKHAI